jgi:hypothetical protein
LADALGNDRRCNPELTCGAGETEESRDPQKCFQVQ